jgi:hypothetical protein
MHRLAQLCKEVAAARRSEEKVAALVSYFSAAPPADAAWTLALMLGRARLPRINPSMLRQWTAEHTDLPPWLIARCYDAVGDWSETMALLLPEPAVTREFALSELIEQRIVPLRRLHPEKQRELVKQSWQELGGEERFLFQKMISGHFRIRVDRSLIVCALSQRAEIPPSIIDDRLWADWQPVPADYLRILGLNDGDAGVGEFGQRSLFDSELAHASVSLAHSTLASVQQERGVQHEPYHIDAVLMYAQRTNDGPVCTFGVWRGDELVSVAKVESEFSETEKFELEKFIWENTTGRSGPVRIVKPELVFEIAFDEVHVSTRRKAGLILYSPRIVRWQKNKTVSQAHALEAVLALVARRP